jgi:hypothetical protein
MILALLIMGLFISQPCGVHAGLSDILRGFGEIFKGRELSETRIIEGLKEALQVGTTQAVQKVSLLDGYFKNPLIHIPLPEQVQKVEKLLRAIGLGAQVDDFELSMNRAAERAAPEAKSLFVDAIKQMTFSDARKILQGRENEATLYFEEKTRDRLYELFEPLVHKTMSKVGVTRSYQELDAKVRTIPFADKLTFDLDEYVTGKALDGLFFMVAEEERMIRQDPAARVTELLKEVFGHVSR